MKNLLTLLFVLFVFFAFAENNAESKNAENASETEFNSLIITGKVIDVYSKERLAGAIIRVKNTDIKTYSNLDGIFTLELPPESSEKDIIVSYISYEEASVSIADNDEEKIIEIKQH